MTACRARDVLRAVVSAVLGCGMVLCSLAGHAQVTTAITPDATLSTPSSVASAGAVHNINGGTPVGNNLFHSFSRFDVGTQEVANFNAASNISNIVSRVTGDFASQIDGTLTATDLGTGLRSGANLFFMNPKGIIFGDNARLDLGGSFHATTADYIKFGNDIFFANPANPANVLSAAPASAFGFLTANPAEITYSSPSFNFLHVANGNTLSLVGGNITIGDGSAPGILIGFAGSPEEAAAFEGRIGGRINLISVASVGDAAFDGTNIDTTSFPQLGSITIQSGSVIDAREIHIRSGQLQVADAFVFPGGVPRIFATEFLLPPDGGIVDIDVRSNVAISGSDFVFGLSPGIITWSGALGDFSLPSDAPDIAIKAGSVSITGTGTVASERFGPGNGADITINTDSLEIRNGGTLLLRNAYCNTCSVDPETSGSITVNAQHVLLSADGNVGLTGISAQAEFHPGYFVFSGDPVLTSADAGTITINASGSLTMRGAEITTDSTNFGRSGDITINAGDVFMSERSAIAAQSLFAGEAGNLRITAARDISMSSGSRVSVSTASSGDGGILDVKAGRSILLSGTDTAIFGVTVPVPDAALDILATIFLGPDVTFPDLVAAVGLDPGTATIFDVMDALNQLGFAAVADLTPGDGGKMSITAPLLSVNSGAVLSSSTLWEGNAGQVEANVANLMVESGGEIRSRSGGIRLDNNQPAVGSGLAGTVTVNANDSITVTGQGSLISTTTFGDGNGGNVDLGAGNRVSIVSGGAVRADSGGTLGGSVVSGAGLGGNITITAGNEIVLTNGQVTTQTLSADGGNITLLAPNLVQLQDSIISTSVKSDVGSGGNIMIDPQFVLVNNSSIIANAFGGPGGNITIIANNFLSSATSIIEASSALSTPGVIEVRSPENNVENNIAQLPAAFVDASALLRGLCTARRTGAPSSFTVAGRGGVPVDADGYLPAFGADTATAVAGRTGGEPPLVFALLANTLDCAR